MLGEGVGLCGKQFGPSAVDDIEDVSEAQLAGVPVRFVGGQCHDCAHQVVGADRHPQFLFQHVIAFDGHVMEPNGSLQGTQIELSGKGLARCADVRPVSSPSP